ncbi:hypothetical protein H5410_006932 [Solanum commersonii]|uniref:Uncharacterized protein n=1 Tax=Solanum commersonii TaxID=4109 RepID=A0A9J6ABZ6_SOLCO|nr:hypothetical protein H5410_006932 [Solanum commersonii]
MERVVNLGPIDRTLLLSQHEHKSELLWKGEISFSSLMITFVREGCSMTMPLLQLWLSVRGQRPIASTYVLDVQVLFGLRIDGDVVYMQDAARRIRPWQYAIAPFNMDSVSRVRIHSITGYLRDQLQVDLIGDGTPVEQVEKISKLYMLVILGDILFLNTLGNLISLQYLVFLDPIHDVGLVLGKDLVVQPSIPPLHHGDGRVELIRILSHIMFLSRLETARPHDEGSEIVEVHAPDRVMRQFGHPQHVSAITSWGTNHHVHDQCGRLGPKVLEMLDKYFCDWGNRYQSLAVEVDDGTSGKGYKLWYMRYGRLLIGKHALEVDVPSCFVHSAGTSIAMSRGLFKLHNLALQWQRDTASASHSEEVS